MNIGMFNIGGMSPFMGVGHLGLGGISAMGSPAVEMPTYGGDFGSIFGGFATAMPSLGMFASLPFAGGVWGIAGGAAAVGDIVASWGQIRAEQRMSHLQPSAAASRPADTAEKPAPQPFKEPDLIGHYIQVATDKNDQTSPSKTSERYKKNIEAMPGGLARDRVRREMAKAVSWMAEGDDKPARRLFATAHKEVGDDLDKMLLNMYAPGSTKIAKNTDFAKAVRPTLGEHWLPKGDEQNEPEAYLRNLKGCLQETFGDDWEKVVRHTYDLTHRRVQHLGVSKEPAYSETHMAQELTKTSVGYSDANARTIAQSIASHVQDTGERRRLIKLIISNVEKDEDAKVSGGLADKAQLAKDRRYQIATQVLVEVIGGYDSKRDEKKISAIIEAATPVKVVGSKKPRAVIDTSVPLSTTVKEIKAFIKADNKNDGSFEALKDARSKERMTAWRKTPEGRRATKAGRRRRVPAGAATPDNPHGLPTKAKGS